MGGCLMDEVIEKTIAALKKHSFKAEFANNLEEAKEIILKQIPKNASVAIPGSATVRATGAVDALKERGNELFDHWEPDLNKAQEMMIRKKQPTADVCLTSANAVSMTGEIVNMDGFGNRVASTIFGPQKVVFVVGKNKIAPDLEAARDRIRKVAAPARAREMECKTPCTEKDECTDCSSPMRICRVELILHRQPVMTMTTVIIVDEELGL
jgi:L-lactate utilization protein LutB